MQFEEFTNCLTWWKQRKKNEHAWKESAADILANGCNLDRRNPKANKHSKHAPPEQIVESVFTKEDKILSILKDVRVLLEREK
jgi:type I restriction enzyme M protein